MPDINTLWEWVFSGLVQNFVWMILAILFVELGQKTYEKWKYGRWRVIVLSHGEEKVNREITTGKVKEILSEPVDMSVFIKGVISPYGWLNCDLLTTGKDIGLFVENRKERRLVIDMDKNPDDGLTKKNKKTESRKKRKEK